MKIVATKILPLYKLLKGFMLGSSEESLPFKSDTDIVYPANQALKNLFLVYQYHFLFYYL
jgi:hypothetical protein